MLYSIDSGKYIEELPHKKEFDNWIRNLSDHDYQKIIEALNDKIDESDINTSSWIPGNNWTGSIYEPIYHACGDNKELSGLFFGLIMFNLLMERQDAVWGFGRYEKNGVSIRGTTYFILQNPPPR